jgi:tRNA threonylcarbamoyladenosine biosynthesis protein TsaE
LITPPVTLADEAALRAAGAAFAPFLKAGDIIALSGDLGAGKSTFARGLLAGLGFEGEVPSPSFALVIPYAPPAVRLPLWHVDLYRLEDGREAEALALDEALWDGTLVIEWPERLGDRLWPEALKLRLDFAPEGGRILTVNASPSWEGRCPQI